MKMQCLKQRIIEAVVHNLLSRSRTEREKKTIRTDFLLILSFSFVGCINAYALSKKIKAFTTKMPLPIMMSSPKHHPSIKYGYTTDSLIQTQHLFYMLLIQQYGRKLNRTIIQAPCSRTVTSGRHRLQYLVRLLFTIVVIQSRLCFVFNIE